MARGRGLLLVVAGGLLLSGCETVGGWLGESEPPPLPGERIAILQTDGGLEADPAVADAPVDLPAPLRNGSWPQPGGVAAHNLQHLALDGSLRVAWSVDIGVGNDDDARLLAQPIVVDGVVYTMDARSQVSAVDAERGRKLWITELEPEGEEDGYFGGGLAYADGRLVATTGFGGVFALDPKDGSRLWVTTLGAPLRAAPTIADGRVFVVTLENQTEALAAEDGQVLWTHTGIQEIAGLVGQASPAVAGSTVIVPYSSGEIFALRAENGRVLWNDSLAAVRRTDQANDIAQVRGLPVVDRSLVFAIGHSGRLAAIDLRRGARAWEVELAGIEMPWVAGDTVFVVSLDGQLAALTRERGRVRWVTRLPEFGDPENRADPIIWRGPVLAGGRLILASSRGELRVFSPEDGAELGSYDLPAGVAVAPVVAGGTVYLITADGSLLALR